MLAAHNASFGNIAQELYKANADERIRLECEAREEFYFQQRRQQERWKEAKAEQRRQQERIEEAKAEQRRQQERLEEAKAEQRRQQQRIEGQRQEIKNLRRNNSAKDETIASQSEIISSLETENSQLRKMLAALGLNE